jgi:RHS repeat-associated protein
VNGSERRIHFHLDHLGTPRLITGSGGARISARTFHPFGDEITAPDTEPLKFTGHERDVNGLDYMHARYYDAKWGRFLSVDPEMSPARNLRVPQRWNRYAYALNSPITRFDPDGRKDRIYVVNALGAGAFSSRQQAALNAAVVGTRFEGRVTVVGPMANNNTILRIASRADSTDMVGMLIHAGRSFSGDGNIMTQKAVDASRSSGKLQGVMTGSTLAAAVNDKSPAGVCMIAGCSSDQIARTVNGAASVTTFGTTNYAGADQQGNALVAALGALANGATPEAAAQAASQQYTRKPDCGGAADCDPSRPATLEANPPE